MNEKDKVFLDYLKKVSPGTPLRTVINDILRSNLGALIIFETPEIEKILDGGFRVNCRFTPQRLFELSKMDGAITISQDQRRIGYANVLLTPNPAIQTSETGTRHRAGERSAKQMNTLVIAVSERKRKTTLFIGDMKYTLRPTEEVFNEISNILQVLEKQREMLDELLSRTNILEVSNLVSALDIARIIQRTEIILRHSEILKKDFMEAGKDGNLLALRFKELLWGVEKKEEFILRDYAKYSLKKAKTILDNLTSDGLLDLEAISRLVLEKNLSESISPRGYRFLSEIKITEKESSILVKSLGNLGEILSDKNNKIELLFQSRAEKIKLDIEELREKILEGRIIL